MLDCGKEKKVEQQDTKEQNTTKKSNRRILAEFLCQEIQGQCHSFGSCGICLFTVSFTRDAFSSHRKYMKPFQKEAAKSSGYVQ